MSYDWCKKYANKEHADICYKEGYKKGKEDTIHKVASCQREFDELVKNMNKYEQLINSRTTVLIKSAENQNEINIAFLLSRPKKNYPFIIVEGADCTGKTTLVNRLKEYYYGKNECVIVNHFTYPMEPDVRTNTFEAAINIGKNPRYAVNIFDRHWISELIYSQVYRKDTTDTVLLMNHCIGIYTYLEMLKPFYIITHIDNSTQSENYKKSNDEMYPDDNRVYEVNDLYKKFIDETCEHSVKNVVSYNYEIDSFENIVKSIEAWNLLETNFSLYNKIDYVSNIMLEVINNRLM